MAEVMHAFVSGVGAGVAFALCQAVTLWLAQRRSEKRAREQIKGLEAAFDRAREANATIGAALSVVPGSGGGDVN